MTATTPSADPLHDCLCKMAGGYVPKAEKAEVERLATESLKAERDDLLSLVRDMCAAWGNADTGTDYYLLNRATTDARALLARIEGGGK